MSSIADLPEDIIHVILSFLPPSTFLAFCSTTRALKENPSIIHSPSYWSKVTRETFRVPGYPVVEHDGRRWLQLYRRMRTQTEIYGWGADDGGCLYTPLKPRNHRFPHKGHWPIPMRFGDIGIIADLQCGGWSITALNSKGQLYTNGVINRLDTHIGSGLRLLKFPSNFESSDDLYNADSAIKQFSSGRSHILALSDSGKIWCWTDSELHGISMRFWNHDLIESHSKDLNRKVGSVRNVVAGWDQSSAYIFGKGIVCWKQLRSNEFDKDKDDSVLIADSWVVPGTSHLRPNGRSQIARNSSEYAEIGEVISWVVLEHLVIFVTHTGGLYASPIPGSPRFTPDSSSRTIRLDTTEDPEEAIIDVQGSFRSFAVFRRSGAVLVGDQDAVHAIIERQQVFGLRIIPDDLPMATKLRKIPALQNSGVIALAFGDWHFHALHSDGTISSYGKSPRFRSALGLASEFTQICRGINEANEELWEECLSTGRRVWFEKEKDRWLHWLSRPSGRLPPIDGENRARWAMAKRERAVQVEVSEYIEERLRRWELDAPKHEHITEETSEEEDDELPAYFALNVAASGWHSSALMLVNTRKAERIRGRYKPKLTPKEVLPDGSVVYNAAKSVFKIFFGSDERSIVPRWIWEQDETFPRLKLKSGDIMPGTRKIEEVPDHLRDWKHVEYVSL